MKTRTLFLTLLTSISILLINNGTAFAEQITGCVKKSNGQLYNVQMGDEPAFPGCNFRDNPPITWSEEGPQGEPGDPGADGEDGQDGTIIHQVHLEDSNETDCENATFPPTLDNIGWCPNGSKNIFLIPDPMITPNSVVVAHLAEITLPIPHCQVRFINPNFPGTPIFNFTCDFGTPVPPDGVPLNYVIINPPPTP